MTRSGEKLYGQDKREGLFGSPRFQRGFLIAFLVLIVSAFALPWML